MRRTYVVGVAAAIGLLTLTGCGQADAEGGPGGHGPADHTLTVMTTIKPGDKGAMFTEGASPEIRLVAPDGSHINPVRDHVDKPVFENLAAGRYLLTAVLRPCDGNCGYLDGPTSPCRTFIDVPADTTALVTWRVGENCHAH
jgi:hypothetical protein